MNDQQLNDLIDRTASVLAADATMACMVAMDAEERGVSAEDVIRDVTFGVVALCEAMSRTDIPDHQWEEAIEQAGPIAARWVQRQRELAEAAA